MICLSPLILASHLVGAPGPPPLDPDLGLPRAHLNANFHQNSGIIGQIHKV